MKATAGSQSKFEPVKPDSYHAVCYGVADLGTQHSPQFNSDSRKVLIMWELPDETYESDGKQIPRTINKQYTLTLNNKSTLNHDLVGWRGAPFTDADIQAGFEMRKLLTQNCILTVVTSNTGKSSVVQSVSKIMKTMVKKQPSRKIVYYDIDENGTAIPEGLPKWAYEDIKNSPEYKAIGGVTQSDMEAIDNLPVDEPVEFEEQAEQTTDEIPF